MSFRVASHGEPPRFRNTLAVEDFDGLRPLTEDMIVAGRGLQDRPEIDRGIRRPEHGDHTLTAQLSDRPAQDSAASGHQNDPDTASSCAGQEPSVDPLEVEALEKGGAFTQPPRNEMAAVVERQEFMAQCHKGPLHVLRDRLVVRVVVSRQQDLHTAPATLLIGFKAYCDRVHPVTPRAFRRQNTSSSRA